ncbi:MAG: tetratricopeptide repeat protein [Salinivirgaceae bacterium]|nr:tetratricopeptide repeat protein [Salinivirgaceae bacterium]
MLCCLLTAFQSVCQTANKQTDSQLAMQYYRQGDYQKAADVFARLYQNGHSDFYYGYYLKSLQQIPDYEAAEKLVQTQMKLNRGNLKYNVDLGFLQELKGNPDRAKQIYHQSIKKLTANINLIDNLASAFIDNRLYNYAEEAYTEGRKLMKGAYDFRMEMAQLFYYQRNYTQMVVEFLELLRVSDVYLQQVQNYLQQAIYNDSDESLNQMLIGKLMEYSQNYPDNKVFAELLIWIFVQDRDFPMALVQAKALDRRLNEDGNRVVSLARMESDNNDFATAIEAYQYVIDKGGNQEYTNAARTEMLQVMFRRVELGIDNQLADYQRLESALTDALQDMGIDAETVDLVRSLAKLKAVYLGKTADAQFLLEDARTMRLQKSTLAAIDIELADVYLMQGNDVDATLTYAQVEDNNRNNPVGSEAKLRKARLAYYIGNFKWAQAQLDALKASVEKLTANDAAYLSLLIEDNTGWDDASDTAMLIYARADLLHYQHNDSMALRCIDSIVGGFPDAPIVDEALFLKAEIYRAANNLDKAIAAYQTVADRFPDDVLADNANYMLATIYENQLNDKQLAMQYYLKIITDYASSIFVTDSRKRYRALRGDVQ